MQPKKIGANPDRLTPNQRLFCEYLLADPQFNGTAAARAAGYKNPGIAASKLMKSKPVRATIGKAIMERIREVKLTQKDVLEHLATALFLDPLEMFERTERGAYVVRDLDDVPERIRRCITKLKCRTKEDRSGRKETWVEIELMSKDQALPLAMKHLGIAGSDSVTVDVGGDVLLNLLKQVEQDRRVIDVDYIRRIGSDELEQRPPSSNGDGRRAGEGEGVR